MKKRWLGVLGLFVATAAYAGVIVHGQLVDASAENLASDPTSHNGRFYYNTTSHFFKFFDGSIWQSLSQMIIDVSPILNSNAGAILFPSSTGILTQDPTNLFWDFTNKRLGIGTNTPSSKVYVKSTSADHVFSYLENTHSDYSSAFIAKNDAGNSLEIGIYGSTEAPAGVLTTGSSFLYADGAGGFTFAAGHASGPLVFASGGLVERARFAANGNFSIGEATAPSPLSVGTAAQFQVDSSGNIVKLRNVTTSFPSSQGSADRYLRNDGSGNLTWAQTSLTAGVTGVLPAANMAAATTSAAGTVTYEDSGTFSATFTGPCSSGALTVHYSRVGKNVCLYVPGFTCTSTVGAAFTAGSGTVATALRPTVANAIFPAIIENSTATPSTPGTVSSFTNGDLEIFKDYASANFTGSGTAGLIVGASLCYTIN